MADPFTEGHIVSEQQRESALGAHINTFKSIVSDLGSQASAAVLSAETPSND